MQTWVVVAGAIVGLAAASAVSLRQISGFLIGACLALGMVHAVREVFDPIFLPTSAGFVNPNSLSTLLVVALLCWIHQVASRWGRSSFPRRPLELAGWFGIGLLLVLLLIPCSCRDPFRTYHDERHVVVDEEMLRSASVLALVSVPWSPIRR